VVRNQAEWELVNGLQYFVGLYNIYLFWRMISLCIDPYDVYKNLSKQGKEEFSVPDCSRNKTKIIVLLLYGPVFIVFRLLVQLLSPDSLRQWLVIATWIEVILRWITTTLVMKYSRKTAVMITPFTRIWWPKAKLITVMLMYPVTLLVHDTFFLQSVVAYEERYKEVTSNAYAYAKVFYQTKMGVKAERVLQGQILILSVAYWILWSVNDIRSVFEHSTSRDTEGGYISQGGSTQWEDVNQDDRGDQVG